VTCLSLPGLSVKFFRLFLSFLHTSKFSLTFVDLPSFLGIACDVRSGSLLDVFANYVDSVSNRQTVLSLLRELSFALHHFPRFAKFRAALIEAQTRDTDFSFLTLDQLKLLVSLGRFTALYFRDDIISRYLSGASALAEAFSEFTLPIPEVLDDTIERSAYSAVFIYSPSTKVSCIRLICPRPATQERLQSSSLR
jgi:hypothetical protein